MSVLPPADVQTKGRGSPMTLCADPETVPPLLTPEAVPVVPPNVPMSVIVVPFQKKGWFVDEPVGTDSPTTRPHWSSPTPELVPPSVPTSVTM
jgi:hypothetical protein